MTIIQSIFNNKNRTTNDIIKQYIKTLGTLNFKVIHVVGTNGKGSVSHYLTTNLLKKYKVGTFTSPHIFKTNERIKVNNKEIPTKELENLVLKYKDLHFFAIMYLSAIEYFKLQGCEIVIIEAGVGGRLDSTNTLPGQIGVLTSIGLDHMEFLGNTKEEILLDKIGIMNKGMNFYTGTEVSQYNQIINKECNLVGSNHIQINNIEKKYKLRNQKLASAILDKEFNIKGLFNELQGRTTIQKINNTKAFIDVSHNKDGIKATLEYLQEINESFDQVVITIAKRKDSNNLNLLFKGKEIFVYQLNGEFISADKLNAKEVVNLKEFYNKQNKNTLYIGSFYSVGEVLHEK